VQTKDKGGKRMRVEILLKKIREERGYSLEELSKITGISKSHLNYIEKNEKEPSLSMAIRIAQALNIKIEELYKIYP
jgi:DNA-binding XRE family transcriptional regulator